MDALQQILAWDEGLFLSLNGLHSPFFDNFMWLFSSKLIWVPTALGVVYALVKDKRKELLFILAGIILTIVLCDQLSSSVIKPFFHRLRPSHQFGDLVHVINGYRGGRYGFVSSHAANAFGFALFTSLIFRFIPYTIATFTWAVVNSYSRIYLGVHYPSDIFCGALLGLACAYVAYLLLCYITKLYKKRTSTVTLNDTPLPAPDNMRRHKSLWTVISILVLSVIYISVYSVK
ncbi:MAG: phosphatase PAP2 family protein [Tannerella sp.]|jgi:undecaprenyl-diphosphatase|nr:phosphatase PAP2 family protein [Tannerella sp.]